ncbi:MAG TPA: asparagine synthase-related protein [Steroidobacter sp.]
MHRYLAILWDAGDPQGLQLSQSFKAAIQSRSADWCIDYDGPGAIVVHALLPARATQRYELNTDAGVVIGRLFHNIGGNSELRSVRFDVDETRRIVNSAGQHLVNRYWGSYFALVFDQATRRRHVFRDPIGNVPLYQLSHRSLQVFFSHIEDCVRFFPRSWTVNRSFLTRWLLFSGVRNRECSLEGVAEVPAGERLTLSAGRIDRALLWSPSQIATTPREDGPEIAAAAFRATLQETINAWASCYQVITHQLSGGLDSSIVAGCLAQAPSRPSINYVNFSIDVGLDRERGDERHLARLVAERWRAPLLERQRDVSTGLSRLWRAPASINPSMYFTAMDADDVKLELAESLGTEAFFSGQGGDSVLLATVQPFPAIDYAHLHGIGPGLWPHLLASTRLSRESVWDVLGKAVRHGLLRRSYRPLRSILEVPNLLPDELTAELSDEDFAGARTAAPTLPAGKQNHVTGVHWASYYDFVFRSGAYADDVDPLNAQPVWELMLQLPTYAILNDGISRGLARRAFADLLPPEIRRRQAKGIGTPFYQQVVRRNRVRLREWLLDGALVREGYLDRDKLHRCLAADEPFVTVSASQILSYLAAEVWLRQWSRGAVRAVPASADIVGTWRGPDPHGPAARSGTNRDSAK